MSLQGTIEAPSNTGGFNWGAETGRLLWKGLLPSGAQATPMTYEVAGTQYVWVISAGGHGKLGATLGDYVMAFSLPAGGSNPGGQIADVS